MEPKTTPTPWIARRTIGAVLGGLAGAALIVGVAGAVVDGDDSTGTAFVADTTGSTDSTTDDSTDDSTDVTGEPTTEVILAKDAGSVTVASDGAQLRVVGTSANPGWTVEIERGTGREVEVKFESGARRIDVNAELEDGEIRTRVRERGIDDDGTSTTDDSTDATTDDSANNTTDDSTDATTDDSTSTTVDDHGGDDDNSGPGHGDDDDDDRHGHGDDDDDDDDDRSGSNSGPG